MIAGEKEIESDSIIGTRYSNYAGETEKERSMSSYRIINLKELPEQKELAAAWFHEKWGIPTETYLESMEESFKNKAAVPQWYIVMADEKIIGGAGIIENDFHERRDLTPNVCAVYVEEEHRRQGIAGELLHHICQEMHEQGIDTLYLVTDHTSFYERYGWEFLCLVKNEGEDAQSRMYIHRQP